MRRGKVGPTLRCSQNWTEDLSGKRIQLCARQLASNDEFDHWQLCFGKAQRPFTKRQGIRIRDYRRQPTKNLFSVTWSTCVQHHPDPAFTSASWTSPAAS
ncbi:hypothetical protein M0R45_024733 [Rubus argutus]|uniref:Uncharacterized protein n=1 Tax=Rubus argutus TaxID=59490 RepID=A0AAW1WTB7_RUBAR